MAGKDKEYVEPRVKDAEKLEARQLRAYVGQFLKAHPKDQNRLARTVGVSDAWLSRFQKKGEGDLSLAKLRLILKAMGIPLGSYLESVGVGVVEMIGPEMFADLQVGQAMRVSQDPTIPAGLRKAAKEFLKRPVAASGLPASPIIRQLALEAGRLTPDQQRTIVRLSRGLAATTDSQPCLTCGGPALRQSPDGICLRCQLGRSGTLVEKAPD